MKTTQENIQAISGGEKTWKMSAGATYDGSQGLVIGMYHTSAPATYSGLTDSEGNNVLIGDSLSFDAVVPLIRPSVPLKTITCDVEYNLILG